MIPDPASRLLLLGLEAIQREAALRVQAMVEASATEDNRLPGEWQLDFANKQWVKLELGK